MTRSAVEMQGSCDAKFDAVRQALLKLMVPVPHAQ